MTSITSPPDSDSLSTNVPTRKERTVLLDTSQEPITVTLSDADTIDGKKVKIVDSTGNAGTNTITIQTQGSQTINGEPDALIDQDFEGVTLQSDGSDFFIVSRTAGGSVQ